MTLSNICFDKLFMVSCVCVCVCDLCGNYLVFLSLEKEVNVGLDVCLCEISL